MAKIYNASLLVRKLIGLFLIGIFTLSIAPVAFLHDAVANHKDVCYHHFQASGKQITKADINCKCISFVAEARFLPASQTHYIIAQVPVRLVKNIFHSTRFYSQHHFYTELRGPPSLS